MRLSFLPIRRGRSAFRALFGAAVTSVLGDQFTRTAVAVLALDLSGNAAPMALVYVAGYLPGVFLGPVAGTWVDQGNRRTIMVVCNLVRAAAVAAMMLATQVWHLYVLSLLLGMASCLFQPAYQATLPLVVTRGEIMPANQLLQFSSNLAEVAGAVLAVGWFSLASVRTAFMVDALSFGVSTLFLVVGLTDSAAAAGETRAAETDFWQITGEGFRFSLRDPLVALSTLVQFIAALGMAGSNAILPILARELLGQEQQWGLLSAAITGGAMVGALLPGWVTVRLGRDATVMLGLAGGAGVMFALLLTGSLPIAIALFILAGLFNALFYITMQSWLQEEVPAGILGRVLSLRAMTAGVAVIASATGAGFLVDRIGFGPVWIGLSALIMVAGLLAASLGLTRSRGKGDMAAP